MRFLWKSREGHPKAFLILKVYGFCWEFVWCSDRPVFKSRAPGSHTGIRLNVQSPETAVWVQGQVHAQVPGLKQLHQNLF